MAYGALYHYLVSPLMHALSLPGSRCPGHGDLLLFFKHDSTSGLCYLLWLLSKKSLFSLSTWPTRSFFCFYQFCVPMSPCRSISPLLSCLHHIYHHLASYYIFIHFLILPVSSLCMAQIVFFTVMSSSSTSVQDILVHTGTASKRVMVLIKTQTCAFLPTDFLTFQPPLLSLVHLPCLLHRLSDFLSEFSSL